METKYNTRHKRLSGILIGCFVLAMVLGLATQSIAFFIHPTGAQANDDAMSFSSASSNSLVTANQRAIQSGRLPMYFEANQGQTDASVQFLSRGKGYTIFLTPTEAILALRKPVSENRAPPQGIQISSQAALRMQFMGAKRNTHLAGLVELEGKVHYYLGKDPKNWHTNIPTYARVKYHDIYPGVDLTFYGNQNQLEYDFAVSPGVDPKIIQLAFQGVQDLELSREGDLLIQIGGGHVRQLKPVIYQMVNGSRKIVEGSYTLSDNHQVGFQVASYDRSLPLVIDPVIIYSTYVGGTGNDRGWDIAVDSEGNAYVTGDTTSTDFPVTDATVNAGQNDAFVLKLNSSLSTLLYATYFGGSLGDQANGIAVDGLGNVYVTGETSSPDMPTIAALDSTPGNLPDAFLLKLDPTGNVLYSTYVGGDGDDVGNDIALDGQGNPYVVGTSTSTDLSTGAGFQVLNLGGSDSFLTKYSSDGTQVLLFTYLGGSNNEFGLGVTVDNSGNAYFTGSTQSSDFPALPTASQPDLAGGTDAFVAKFSSAGLPIYITYLGGSLDDTGNGIAIDGPHNAFVTGITSSLDFPQADGPSNGLQEAFLAELNVNGTHIFSTYLGGSGNETGRDIVVDPSTGNIYLTGFTGSSDFPVLNAIPDQNTFSGGQTDGFVARYTNAGVRLYSTYLGGSGLDGAEGIAYGDSSVYVAGATRSPDFPVTPEAFQTDFAGISQVFVTKIADIPLTVDPVSLTIPVGGSATATASGGLPPYNASSGNETVATVMVQGNTITVQGVVAGSSIITVRDDSIPVQSVTIQVTVTENGDGPLPPPPPIALSVDPTTVSINPGGTATAAVSGGTPPYGVSSGDESIATASLSNGTVTIQGVAEGSTTVTVFEQIAGGNSVQIQVNVTQAPIAFTVDPTSLSVSVGSTANAAANGGQPPYTASSDNPSIASASISGSTVSIQGVSEGSTTVNVGDNAGASVSIQVTVTADGGEQPVGGNELFNISTRAFVQTGDNIMIGGFIVLDDQVDVVIRAIGPSLPVPSPLANPTLELRRVDGTLLAANDDWEASSDPSAIQNATFQGQSLAPSDPLESAIRISLGPGGYTPQVRGVGGQQGIALVEVFKVGGSGRLGNISTRAFVQTGDNIMIGGFIVLSPQVEVVIRAIGPSLPVPSPLANPTLELRRSDGTLLASNDDWGVSSDPSSIQNATFQGQGLAPSNPLESAIRITLGPGGYTPQVRGVGGQGVALVEIFIVDAQPN